MVRADLVCLLGWFEKCKGKSQSTFLGMSVSPSRENEGGPVNSAGKDPVCGQHNPDGGGQNGRKGGRQGKLTSLTHQQLQILRLSVGGWHLNLQLLNVHLHQGFSGAFQAHSPGLGWCHCPLLR